MLEKPRSAVAALRAATSPDHDTVDAAFGSFDLADRASYVAFLLAHARALPAAEAALAAIEGLPAFRPRTPALASDLAALGEPMPSPLAFAPPGGKAGGWGVLYVVEGSRLGGTLLSRSVANGWPAAYLGARHLPGEWRALLAAIDHAPTNERWIDDAVRGARAAFALYHCAANDIFERAVNL